MVPEDLRSEEYGYLTTIGRVTGREHTIEIWFAADDNAVYLISGGRDQSDWVRNLLAQPRAHIRIGKRTFRVRARPDLRDADARRTAAQLLHHKYGAQTSGTADGWERAAYLVALDPSPDA